MATQLSTSDYAARYVTNLYDPGKGEMLASMTNNDGYVLSGVGNSTVTTSSTTVKVVQIADPLSYVTGAFRLYTFEMNASDVCVAVTTKDFDRSANNYLSLAPVSYCVKGSNDSNFNERQGTSAVAVIAGVLTDLRNLQITDLAVLSMEKNDFVQGRPGDMIGGIVTNRAYGANRLKTGTGVINPGDQHVYQAEATSSLAEFNFLTNGHGGNHPPGSNAAPNKETPVGTTFFSSDLIAATNPAGKKRVTNFRTSKITVDYTIAGTVATAGGDYIVTVEILDLAGTTVNTITVTHEVPAAGVFEMEHTTVHSDFTGPAADVRISLKRTNTNPFTPSGMSVTITAEEQGITGATSDSGIIYFIYEGLNAGATLTSNYSGFNDIVPSFDARQSLVAPPSNEVNMSMAKMLVDTTLTDCFRTFSSKYNPQFRALMPQIAAAYHSDVSSGTVKASHGLGNIFRKAIHTGRSITDFVHHNKRAIKTGMKIADRLGYLEGGSDAADIGSELGVL